MELTTYQKYYGNQILASEARILEFPYGSGKSRIVLYAAQKLTDQYGHNRLSGVIFCKNQNVATWAAEITSTTTFDVHTIDSFDDTVFPDSGLLIVPYHIINRQRAKLTYILKRSQPYILVADESTTIKNASAKRTQAVIACADICRTRYKVCLTGNVCPENIQEMWAQVRFSYGSNQPLGATFYRFLSRWFVKTEYGYALNADYRPMLRKLYQQLITRLSPTAYREYKKRLCVDDEQFIIETYTPSKEQARLIAKLMENWAITYATESLTIAEEYNYIMTVLMKAQQISNGFFYDEEKTATLLKSNPKCVRCIDIIKQLLAENSDRRIVVWCYFLADYELLSKALAAAGIPYTLGVGPDSLAMFQDSCSVILAPLTRAEGLNALAIADVDIYYSNVHSNEARDQAEHRIVRLNQKASTVQHIDIAGIGMYDYDIIKLLQTKKLNRQTIKTILNKYRG